MKSNLKNWCGVIAAVILIVGLLSPVYAKNANPGVMPPNAQPHGMTYGELSAAWWQWAFSLPIEQNPFFDENGSCVNGANGQFEFAPVWFLTGVINVSGTAVRDCTVPAGTFLFFPIINSECSTLEGNGTTEEPLRACATAAIDPVTTVAAEIDGVPVKNLTDYRFESPLFTFGPLPDNNVLQFFGVDAPAGATSLSVADGYYLLLAPLSVGQHTIHFTGTIGPPVNFEVDITYNLTVAPRAR
jgi:hypothetical protein